MVNTPSITPLKKTHFLSQKGIHCKWLLVGMCIGLTHAVGVSTWCLLNLLFNNFVTSVMHNYVLNLEKFNQ